MSETTIDAGKATLDGTPHSTSHTQIPSLHIKAAKQQKLEDDINEFLASGGIIREVPAGTRSNLKGDFNESGNFEEFNGLRNRQNNNQRSKQATAQPRANSKTPSQEKGAKVATISTPASHPNSDVKSIAARILEMRQSPSDTSTPKPASPKAANPEKKLEAEAKRKTQAEAAAKAKQAQAEARQQQLESERAAKEKKKKAEQKAKAAAKAKAKAKKQEEQRKLLEEKQAARLAAHNNTIYKRTNETLGERKIRLDEMKAAREAAEAQGLTEFIARCWKHGTISFYIDKKDCSRCSACLKTRINQERKQERDRREANQKALNHALDQQKTSFIGQCKTHGKREFKIESYHSQPTGRCTKCIQNKYLKEKKRNNRNHSNTIRIYLDGLKDPQNPIFKNIYQVNRIIYQCKTRAIGKCKTEFLAPCNKHGLTLYRFNGPLIFDSVICMACEKNEPGLPELTIDPPVFKYTTERERIQIVIQERKKAAIRRESDFYAPCGIHGSTRYSIMGQTARCIACVEIQKNKEKEKYGTSDNYKRIERNQIKAAHTHFHGGKQFIGECLHHGLAPFSISFKGRNYSGYTTTCIECNQFKIFRCNSKK